MNGIHDVLGHCIVGSATYAGKCLSLDEHHIGHAVDNPVVPLVGRNFHILDLTVGLLAFPVDFGSLPLDAVVTAQCCAAGTAATGSDQILYTYPHT